MHPTWRRSSGGVASRRVSWLVGGNCRGRCFPGAIGDLNEQEALPIWLAVVLICALGAFGMGCAGPARVSSSGAEFSC